MIASTLWRRLGSDPAIIGKPLTLDGRTFTIAGVTPPGFRLPVHGPGVEPHLTIARVKDIRPSHAAALRKVLRDVDDDVGECHVSSATLFRSRPTPTGSEYEAVSRVQLAG